MSNEVQMNELSDFAKAALLAAPSWNQGEWVVGPASQRRELYEQGLIGPLGGLTRKGSIAAQKLKQARERELFGL